MIPDDTRKLKRGLKDISPLFERGTAVPSPFILEPAEEKSGLRLVSLFSPDRDAKPLVLSQYLVSQLTAQNHAASVISLRQKDDAWDSFRELCEPSGDRLRPASEISHTLFLDFDPSNPEQFRKIVSILDQCILLVRPEMENLSECYRMMKASVALNPHLEYFLLFDSVSTDAQASLLFEKYGELACRRLGLHLSWLGSVRLQNGRGPSAHLALESLFLGPLTEGESFAKKAIGEFLIQSRNALRPAP